jgi:hypothetical protein
VKAMGAQGQGTRESCSPHLLHEAKRYTHAEPKRYTLNLDPNEKAYTLKPKP